MQVQHFAAGVEHILHRQLLRCGCRLAQCATGTLAGEPQDLRFGGLVRIADAYVHQETVQLRFRQREGTFLLDRVLRGHHQEQRRQRIGVAANGDLALAHRFQQCRLHLGWRAIDFIGQQDRVEDRAGYEFEVPFLRAPDLGAGQVGRQQVGGELHAGEIRLQARGQCADGRGLGQSRGALHQQVPVGQQCDQQAFDQSRLADDFGRQRVAQLVEGAMQAGGGRRGRRRGGFGHRRWQVHGGL